MVRGQTVLSWMTHFTMEKVVPGQLTAAKVPAIKMWLFIT
jgi:hypothetical protein